MLVIDLFPAFLSFCSPPPHCSSHSVLGSLCSSSSFPTPSPHTGCFPGLEHFLTGSQRPGSLSCSFFKSQLKFCFQRGLACLSHLKKTPLSFPPSSLLLYPSYTVILSYSFPSQNVPQPEIILTIELFTFSLSVSPSWMVSATGMGT